LRKPDKITLALLS